VAAIVVVDPAVAAIADQVAAVDANHKMQFRRSYFSKKHGLVL
jgi:hypothetical protein